MGALKADVGRLKVGLSGKAFVIAGLKIEGLINLEMYAASSEWNHHTHRLMVRVFTGAEALLTL